MSRERLLPTALHRLHARYRTPVPAIMLTAVVMAVVIEWVDLARVAKLASAVVITVFVAEQLSVIAFREARVRWYKPRFRTPMYPWLPAIGVVGGLGLLFMLGPLALVALLAVCLVGTAVYLLYSRRRTARLGVLRKVAPRGELMRTSEAPPAPDDGSEAEEAAVMVALFGNERSAEMLVDVGAALAADRRVYATHLTEVEHETDIESMLEEDVAVQTLRRRIGALADEGGVDVEFRAVVSRDLVRTVHTITSRVHCEWLVMQWRHGVERAFTSLSPIGWLVNHLEANLAMYRDKGVRHVRKILVAPAPGPHDALLVATADDLAERWGAAISLTRYAGTEPDDEANEAEQSYLDELRRLCRHRDVDTLLIHGEDKVSAFTEASAAFDLLVVAAADVSLRHLLWPTAEERVSAAAKCSVLMLKTPRGRIHEAYSRSPASRPGGVTDTLSDLLEVDAVEPKLAIDQKQALFQHIAQSFEAVTEGVTAKAIADAFWEREREQSTSVGRGVALPHATLAALPYTVVGVFTTKHAIDYQAPDGGPVDVFFATMGPPGNRETHLELLSGIARFVLKTNLLEKLRAAETREDVLVAIRDCNMQLCEERD
jgi:mannitol/fructose-specific phosphotransferase system IIA component (Ntr-type)